MEIDRAVKLMIRRKDFSKLICCVERKRIFNRRCILSWNFEKEEAKIRRISFREFIVIVWKSRGFGKISSFQNWQAGIDQVNILFFEFTFRRHNSQSDHRRLFHSPKKWHHWPWSWNRFTSKISGYLFLLQRLLYFKVVRRWKEKKQKTASVNVLFNPLTFLRRERVYFMCI